MQPTRVASRRRSCAFLSVFVFLASSAGNRFDLALGDDNLFHGNTYKWSTQRTVINLANEVALYNFRSTFSGTHYVTPRIISGQIGFNFLTIHAGNENLASLARTAL